VEFIKTKIAGLLVIKPKVFKDDRGYFFESFRSDLSKKAGINEPFVQDNESFSQKGVLRGLHFQNPPYAQGKLVRVVKGAVQDVAVDIRIGSPTYGQWVSEILTGNNKTMFWIPPGFAHGFLTLEDDTIFQYKCTNYYDKESEGSVVWNDFQLNIHWEMSDPILSEKDQNAPPLNQLDSQFNI
jgi:dTDP-4-dehydrorhamnose 3,5-epimerase